MLLCTVSPTLVPMRAHGLLRRLLIEVARVHSRLLGLADRGALIDHHSYLTTSIFFGKQLSRAKQWTTASKVIIVDVAETSTFRDGLHLQEHILDALPLYHCRLRMARIGDHSDRVCCVRTMAAVLLVDRGGVYGGEKLCRTMVIFFLLSRAIIANLLLVAGGGTRYLARSKQLWLCASDLHESFVPRLHVEI